MNNAFKVKRYGNKRKFRNIELQTRDNRVLAVPKAPKQKAKAKVFQPIAFPQTVKVIRQSC